MSDFDITSSHFLRSPHEDLSKIVQDGAISQVKLPKIGKAFLVSSNDAIIDVLKSPHRFTTSATSIGKKSISAVGGSLPDWKPSSGSLFIKEGNEHRSLRHLLDMSLQKCGIKTFRPTIAALCDSLLNQIKPSKKLSKNQVNLVSEYAGPLPALVMMELLGIPKHDTPDVLKWITHISFPTGYLAGSKRSIAQKKLLSYLQDLFASPEKIPPQSLAYHLSCPSNEIAEVSPNVSANLAYFVLLAGHASTSGLISLGCMTLLDNPSQLTQLTMDWTKAATAVEEILRYASPTQMTAPRYAIETFSFYGQTIKKGDIVFCFLAACNMDPTINSNPTHFDISREQIRQITFGAGAHFCGGAQLAHIISEVALQRLFTFWPDLQHAREASDNNILWSPRIGVRHPSRFIVETNNLSASHWNKRRSSRLKSLNKK